MLQKIDNNSVRGPYFTVTIPDIRTLVYSEGGKIAVIEIEGEGKLWNELSEIEPW